MAEKDPGGVQAVPAGIQPEAPGSEKKEATAAGSLAAIMTQAAKNVAQAPNVHGDETLAKIKQRLTRTEALPNLDLYDRYLMKLQYRGNRTREVALLRDIIGLEKTLELLKAEVIHPETAGNVHQDAVASLAGTSVTVKEDAQDPALQDNSMFNDPNFSSLGTSGASSTEES